MKNRTLKSLSVLLSICLLGTSPVSATDFSDGSDSVSYTHLDVYKRQAQMEPRHGESSFFSELSDKH